MAEDIMILGENAVFSTNCLETGVNNNVLVVAGSGAGKTMSIMEPRLLETFESTLIVTVSKRRIVEKYKTVFSRRGYEVMDLNFSNPMESDICYDPLDNITSYTDIKFLAESIVKSNPRKENANADPFWDDAACTLLCAEIAYVLMKRSNPTFADVLALNNSLVLHEDGNHIETSLDGKFYRLARKAPDCYAVSCWRTLTMLPYKTASCVCGTLNTALDSIFTPELKEMIARKKKLDLDVLASRRTILFLSTSAVNPALNCFVNIFYAQMFKTLFEYAEFSPSGKLPIPVNVLCDDFAVGSQILNFSQYISIFREKQIAVTLLIQSESQLEAMYGTDDCITIINNCDTYVFMGSMDLRTARNISERLNAPIEDVLYMPIGQEFVFRRGQRPIVTQRYSILNDVEYQKITAEYEKRVRESAAQKRREMYGILN